MKVGVVTYKDIDKGYLRSIYFKCLLSVNAKAILKLLPSLFIYYLGTNVYYIGFH